MTPTAYNLLDCIERFIAHADFAVANGRWPMNNSARNSLDELNRAVRRTRQELARALHPATTTKD